jgi:hypothetical protein
MKFLLKYATRQRPDLFCQTLRAWVKHLSGLHEIQFIISVDEDDTKMQEQRVFKVINEAMHHERVEVSFYTGAKEGKIRAINRDIDKCKDFDILICVSDDMVPVKQGYDDRIAQDMAEHYPDFDGVLHYNDGQTNHQLMTLSVIGKKYYDRFGYIYHPAYTSLWCDNEAMVVAKQLERYKYFDDCIIEHQWKRHGDDHIYKVSEANYQRDRAVFNQRSKEGFPECIANATKNNIF